MSCLLKKGILRAAVAALALTLPGLGHAEWKPERPIRLIVPFGPGAATDITARTISDHIAATLGQPIVIENKGAASGIVGTDEGAKANPDGYTWTLAHDPPFTILPHFRDLQYDPLKDFEPISLIATIPMVLVVRPDLPVNTLQELIELARAEPGKLTVASSGTGATSHLASELFKYETNIDILHVPYKAQANGVTDVLGGQVDMIFSSFGPVLPHVQSGKLKALGISVPQRADSFPGVPTIAESGVENFDFSVWTGIAVPAGTPKEIRDEISKAVAKALQEPKVQERFAQLGWIVADGDPEKMRAKIQNDYAMWDTVIKSAGIRMD